MIFGKVAGLPNKMRQMVAEIHRMLSSAATDLQNLFVGSKNGAQNSENGIFVLLTGLGKRFHAGKRKSSPGGEDSS